MGTITDLAERMWAGELDARARAPPRQLRATRRRRRSPTACSCTSASPSANTIDTGDGLVMLDTGAPLDVGPLYDEVRRGGRRRRCAARSTRTTTSTTSSAPSPFEEEAADDGWPRPTVYAPRGPAAPTSTAT